MDIETTLLTRASETSFYSGSEWIAVRDQVRERDGNRCTVGRLLGGQCRGILHVNHILPRSKRPDLELDPDNCGTVCASHHPMWEAVCRTLQLLRGEMPKCKHNHPYPQGRIECERRRREQMLEKRMARLARVLVADSPRTIGGDGTRESQGLHDAPGWESDPSSASLSRQLPLELDRSPALRPAVV